MTSGLVALMLVCNAIFGGVQAGPALSECRSHLRLVGKVVVFREIDCPVEEFNARWFVLDAVPVRSHYGVERSIVHGIFVFCPWPMM